MFLASAIKIWSCFFNVFGVNAILFTLETDSSVEGASPATALVGLASDSFAPAEVTVCSSTVKAFHQITLYHFSVYPIASFLQDLDFIACHLSQLFLLNPQLLGHWTTRCMFDKQNSRTFRSLSFNAPFSFLFIPHLSFFKVWVFKVFISSLFLVLLLYFFPQPLYHDCFPVSSFLSLSSADSSFQIFLMENFVIHSSIIITLSLNGYPEWAILELKRSRVVFYSESYISSQSSHYVIQIDCLPWFQSIALLKGMTQGDFIPFSKKFVTNWLFPCLLI